MHSRPGRLYRVEQPDLGRSVARHRQVAQAERELGIALPPSYKKLVTTVSRFDGGYEVWWVDDPRAGAEIVSANRGRLVPFLIDVVPSESGDSYCFDTRHPDERVEYPIVHFDHEFHHEGSTSFETVASELGEFLLWSVPQAPLAELREIAAAAAHPRPMSLIQNGVLRVSGPVRVGLRLIAAACAGIASFWYSPALPAQATSIGSQSPKAMTPLLTAVDADDLRKAADLLARGADPNAVSMSSTPLARALSHANKEMVLLLLEHGARPRAVDTMGHSHLQTKAT